MSAFLLLELDLLITLRLKMYTLNNRKKSHIYKQVFCILRLSYLLIVGNLNDNIFLKLMEQVWGLQKILKALVKVGKSVVEKYYSDSSIAW